MRPNPIREFGMDPDVPRLREALGPLQAAVAEGSMTPRAANEALGKIADSMVESRRKLPVPTRRKNR